MATAAGKKEAAREVEKDTVPPTMPLTAALKVLNQARAVYDTHPDWVAFYRYLFGPDGIVGQVFPGLKERNDFVWTPEHVEIQEMLSQLRKHTRQPRGEPTRVITIRLPKTVHEALKADAHACHTSMNQLCITKLLQVIDADLVPVEG